ncbi:Sec-independent protein translocase protein tatA/E-like protein [Actinobacteria bacterium OK074]|nr:Sec-independent protein translocase protein tatA/E-like protein [Actinobacteria bacterium OK074]
MLRNGLEPWHLLVVAIVFIVLFGSRKLPDTARALGKSMRILKSEAKAMKEDGATTTATTAESTDASATEPAARLIKAAPGEPTVTAPAAAPRQPEAHTAAS